MTDGDESSYWKSNPYLTERFTGESDALHPQWVIIDLAQTQPSTASALHGPNPMPLNSCAALGWCGRSDARSIHGVWESYPLGAVDTAARFGRASSQ